MGLFTVERSRRSSPSKFIFPWFFLSCVLALSIIFAAEYYVHGVLNQRLLEDKRNLQDPAFPLRTTLDCECRAPDSSGINSVHIPLRTNSRPGSSKYLESEFDTVYREYAARSSEMLNSRNFSRAQFIRHDAGRCGIGNRLQSLVSLFLIGILTDRIVLTTYPDFHEYFAPEGLPDIRFDTYRAQLWAEWRFSKHLNKSICDRPFHDILATQDLSALWEGINVLYLNCIDYSLPLLLVNPTYEKKLARWFPTLEPFHDISAKLLAPSRSARSIVDSFTTAHFSKHKVMIGIHARFIKPVPAHLAPLPEVFSAFAKSLRVKLGVSDDDSIGFYIASDDEERRQLLAKQLGRTRTTEAEDGNDVHGGGDGNVYYQVGDFLAQAKFFGNPGTNHAAHIDLFLLARCQSLIITYASSFGQIAASFAGIAPYSVLGPPKEGLPIPDVWISASTSSEPCGFSYRRVVIPAEDDESWMKKFKELPLWVHYTQCHF